MEIAALLIREVEIMWHRFQHWTEKWAVPVMAAGVTVIAPIHPALLTIFGMIIVDAIFGVWAARSSGELICKAKLSKSLYKLVIYSIVITLSFFVERHALHELFPLSKIIASAIAIYEMRSILDNAGTILNMKEEFKFLANKLGEKHRENIERKK